MELRQLEYFVTVAEELNFSRAAERLNMTQPPLSTQIKALESELGVQLFQRSTRRVQLTPAGAYFWASSQRLLAQLQDNVVQARAAASGQVGRLTLGIVPSATIELIPSILRAFRDSNPGVRMTLHEATPVQQVEGLRSGTVDCGCFYLPFGADPPFGEISLASLAVSSEPLVAALPSNHPLTTHQRLPLALLEGEPFVMVSGHRGSGLRDAIQEQCRRGGIVPEIVQEAALIQTVAGLVASGVGVALLPASIRGLHRIGVTYRPLQEESIIVRMGLVWLRRTTNPIVADFIALAQRVSRSAEAD